MTSPLLKMLSCSALVVSSFFVQPVLADSHSVKLEKVIEAREDKDKARDIYRHPQQTLEFFGVKPGMKIGEVLPGGGWYSKILADYLGQHGALYGINYRDDFWGKLGFFSQEQIAERVASTKQFPALIKKLSNSGIESQGFTFTQVPPNLHNRLDGVLFIRALHNLERYEQDFKMRSEALKDTFQLLKPGGFVGVVQHRAPDDSAAALIQGTRGYLSTQQVVSFFEKAGFKLVKQTEINANPKDKPSAEEIVWRLPPFLIGAKTDAEKAKALAIGESDRMTLLFKKPR